MDFYNCAFSCRQIYALPALVLAHILGDEQQLLECGYQMEAVDSQSVNTAYTSPSHVSGICPRLAPYSHTVSLSILVTVQRFRKFWDKVTNLMVINK